MWFRIRTTNNFFDDYLDLEILEEESEEIVLNSGEESSMPKNLSPISGDELSNQASDAAKQ